MALATLYLPAYSSTALRTQTFLLWLKNQIIAQPGWSVSGSATGSGYSTSLDLWTVATDIGLGAYAILAHTSGVKLQIGRHQATDHYFSMSGVPNSAAWTPASNTEIPVPTNSDRRIVLRHKASDPEITVDTTTTQAGFESTATYTYKAFLWIEDASVFLSIWSYGSNQWLLSAYALKLDAPAAADTRAVVYGGYSSGSPSANAMSAYYLTGGSANGCHMCNHSTPANNTRCYFVIYGRLNSSSVGSYYVWDKTNNYGNPFSSYSGKWLEEDIYIVDSASPSPTLRGKLPMLRWVNWSMPNGLVSNDGTRIVLGNFSLPWVAGTPVF